MLGLNIQHLIYNQFGDKNMQSSNLEAIYKSSLDTRLLNDYLVKIDRMSMVNSLEVRSPFLDKDLISYTAQLDFDILNKNGVTKYLLKQLSNKYIDPSFSSREKKGFSIPMDVWLRTDLKKWAEDILFSGRLENRKVFNLKYVEHIFTQHQERNHDHTHKIWSLICLELWFQKFIDRQ